MAELFNQTLKAIYAATDHAAVGVPGQSGCDNILMSNYEAQIVASQVRCNGAVAVTEGEHTITFSSTLGTADITVNIIDYQQLGVFLVSWTATGFTYNCLAVGGGNIGYFACKNI
jgi:hypothetical protein